MATLKAAPGTGSGNLLNRELSTLAYLDRLLDLAADESLPILERVKMVGTSRPTWTTSSWSGSPA